MTHYVYDDGGRKAAGYRGAAGDCAVRAVAIAMRRPYAEVYAELSAACRGEKLKRKRSASARDGVHRSTMRRYMASVGWEWVPCMGIGTGCTVHLRADELPPAVTVRGGAIICAVSKHYVAVVDEVIRDTHDSSRDGTRCVYGYWRPPVRDARAQDEEVANDPRA